MFALRIGRLAVDRILAGYGYEITVLDLAGALDHFLAAARQLGTEANAQNDLSAILSAHPEAPSFFRTSIERHLGRQR